MAPTLPVEMVEHAVDFLHDDVHALAACALASRILLRISRFHIWHDLVVPVQTHPTHPRMRGLVEILESNADIAPLVRSLTLTGILSPQPRNRIRQRWDDPAGTMRLWEGLSNLRVLKFEFLVFPMGLHQLLPVAYALPHLEEIAVFGSQAILPREHLTRPSFRHSVTALNAPPKLKRLTLVGGSISWSFLEDLAKLLLEPGMLAPLDTLDLSCVSNSDNFKYATADHTDTLPSQAWAPAIASLASTLRHCTLRLLAVECFPANIVNLYASLEQCTHLRTLDIQSNAAIHPDDYSDHSPFMFLDMLADVLSPASSASNPRSLLPFPELHTLNIGWLWTPEPISSGCQEAWKNLARVLEDRSGQSSSVLRHLDVTVRRGPIRRSAGISAEHREAMAALEPVLRSYFEGAVSAGVQLRVDTICVG